MPREQTIHYYVFSNITSSQKFNCKLINNVRAKFYYFVAGQKRRRMRRLSFKTKHQNLGVKAGRLMNG